MFILFVQLFFKLICVVFISKAGKFWKRSKSSWIFLMETRMQRPSLPVFQKPSSVRIDQLDREQFNPDVITFPIIVHFGIRPAQLSYAGDPQ